MAEKVTIGNCELWHGDCREVLPLLPPVDLVLTDPPYGVGLEYESFSDTEDAATEIGVFAVEWGIANSKRCVVTPGTRIAFNYPKPTEIGCLYFPAGAGMSRWGFTCFQPILFYGKDPDPPTRKRPNSRSSTEISEKNGHPCPKPAKMMLWLVDRASVIGESVLDPFMGSGSTAIACINLGRSFVGIERERKYFDIACRRIEQAYAQPRLFEDAKVGAGDTAVQGDMLLPANVELSGPTAALSPEGPAQTQGSASD